MLSQLTCCSVVNRASETKYDVRFQEYFRVYDEKGELQRQELVSWQLDACLFGEGG